MPVPKTPCINQIGPFSLHSQVFSDFTFKENFLAPICSSTQIVFEIFKISTNKDPNIVN